MNLTSLEQFVNHVLEDVKLTARKDVVVQTFRWIEKDGARISVSTYSVTLKPAHDEEHVKVYVEHGVTDMSHPLVIPRLLIFPYVTQWAKIIQEAAALEARYKEFREE